MDCLLFCFLFHFQIHIVCRVKRRNIFVDVVTTLHSN